MGRETTGKGSALCVRGWKRGVYSEASRALRVRLIMRSRWFRPYVKCVGGVRGDIIQVLRCIA
jgi:hypothetical protein